MLASGEVLCGSAIFEPGQRGGQLKFGQRLEPRTLNPLVATDISSRQILGLLHSDLIHINRVTQRTEPALAESWSVSPDFRQYTLKLRSGVRFSDGSPFSADDVVFTFQNYLDETVHSSQRDLLIVGGEPIVVRKIAADVVQFLLAAPYAAAERLFDGIAILPKHLLISVRARGPLDKAWPLSVRPSDVVGLGPFRFKQYVPGERVVLERNPYYWKVDSVGQRLPYLDALIAVTTSSSQGEAMRFGAGELDVADRLSPADYLALKRYSGTRRMRLSDLGPGLEFDFLFFNLNRAQRAAAMEDGGRSRFEHTEFRRGIAAAIDRTALVKVAFRNLAVTLGTFVPPSDAHWVNQALAPWQYSEQDAKRILQNAGYRPNAQGYLQDRQGKVLRFSIAYNAANAQHEMMATLIQDDLKRVGVQINLMALESHSLLDRVFRTFDYEAAIMAIAGNDTDPNSEINIWSSEGGTHVWDLTRNEADTPWQREIDRLMAEQMITPDYRKRKVIYDRIQEIVRVNLPIISLVSPHVLVGAKDSLGNYRPAILADHNLWNAEYLYIRKGLSGPVYVHR